MIYRELLSNEFIISLVMFRMGVGGFFSEYVNWTVASIGNNEVVLLYEDHGTSAPTKMH